MDGITEYLAHYGSSIAYEDFPPEAVHKVLLKWIPTA